MQPPMSLCEPAAFCWVCESRWLFSKWDVCTHSKASIFSPLSQHTQVLEISIMDLEQPPVSNWEGRGRTGTMSSPLFAVLFPCLPCGDWERTSGLHAWWLDTTDHLLSLGAPENSYMGRLAMCLQKPKGTSESSEKGREAGCLGSFLSSHPTTPSKTMASLCLGSFAGRPLMPVQFRSSILSVHINGAGLRALKTKSSVQPQVALAILG